MIKPWIELAAACALLSMGSVALAGLPCPHDDKKVPEKTKVCRYGTVHQCVDGQWISLGTKCTQPKLREDAAAPGWRRMLGEAQSGPLALRFARQS